MLAIAEQGCLLNAPDVYMDKLAVGPGYPDGMIDLDKSPTDNVRAVAAAKGVEPADIIACVLDRPRHEKHDRRAARARLRHPADPRRRRRRRDRDHRSRHRHRHLYGLGRRARGRARRRRAALRRRPVPGPARCSATTTSARRAARWGIEDLDRIYQLEDLAKGDCIFAATGVTDGSLLDGVQRRKGMITTESVVMRASTGTVRRVSQNIATSTHRGLYDPAKAATLRSSR